MARDRHGLRGTSQLPARRRSHPGSHREHDAQPSIVEAREVVATSVIPAQAEAHTYAMAGGGSEPGILWEEDAGSPSLPGLADH